MAEPFVGEIKMFAGNFAPRGYALCDGQVLSIAQNDALFSLLGTTHGGDGRTTFGLPDLRGRIPIHSGQGPGLATRSLGQKGGTEAVTLGLTQIPPHSHALQSSFAEADHRNPRGRLPARPIEPLYNSRFSTRAAMNSNAIGPAGGSQGHNNLAPYQCVNFIIALVGVYPSRS